MTPEKATPFIPRRFLSCRHRQTIFGAVPGKSNHLAGRTQHQVELFDGDQLYVYDDSSASATSSEEPTVLLVHGLGGSHRSGYMTRIASRLRHQGRRVFRMDLRGCGNGISIAKRTAHAGASEDLAQAAHWIQQHTHSAIQIVAFSLSGNILLKMLSEPELTNPLQIAKAIAISPPIDLAYSSLQITRRYLGFYNYQFMRSLKKDIARRKVHHPECPWTDLTPFPKTLLDFDNRFTAPLNGFTDAEQYYERSSSKNLLDQITTPTTILVADDDPVVPSEIFDDVDLSNSTTLIRTRHGGHMGYLGRRGQRWMDDQILAWLR